MEVENKAEEGPTSKTSTSHNPIEWLLGSTLLTPQTSKEEMSEEI
jgi:hypothetical protein